jgi:hypothetical protein
MNYSPLFHEPDSPIRTWQEVADEYNRRTGKRMDWRNAQFVGRLAIKKLRRLLLDAQQGRANASERSRTSQRSCKGV